MLQFGQQARKIFSRLFLCKIFIRHMPGEKIQQLIHAFISKISVCIAPFAIVLIKAVIFFSAYKAVVLQRHTAALADKLARTTEQSIYRNIKLLRYFLKISVFGVVSPFSQRETACRVTNSLSAISSCVKLFFVLISFNISLVSI